MAMRNKLTRKMNKMKRMSNLKACIKKTRKVAISNVPSQEIS